MSNDRHYRRGHVRSRERWDVAELDLRRFGPATVPRRHRQLADTTLLANSDCVRRRQ
jgi:hypothetical protein